MRIARWFADGQHDFGLIDTDENTEKTLYGESRGEALTALKDLRRRVAASRRQRSEFDLQALFTAYPSDFSRDEDHTKLRQGEAPPIPAWHDPALPGQLAQLGMDTAIDELILQAHSAHPGQHAGAMYGRVADVDEFLRLLFSDNLADQQDALHNRLQGGPLPPPSVERVVRHDGFKQSSPNWQGQLLTQLAPLEAQALPPVLAGLATHHGELTSCAFSFDGQYILTASTDHTAKLWDAHSGALLRSFDGHTDSVNSCAFSPDGQHILTTSADSTTRLWNASTGELVHTYFSSQTDNLALSWPARLQDFLDRRCTLRAIDPDQPINLSKPRNWILQDQRLAERQPVRTWPLEVLISRYGDDASQALLASGQNTTATSAPLAR